MSPPLTPEESRELLLKVREIYVHLGIGGTRPAKIVDIRREAYLFALQWKEKQSRKAK